MRTRTRKPIPYATLLNHYDWASRRNHGREMRKAREENETLKLALRLKQAMAILMLAPCLLFAQPPLPPAMPASAQIRLLNQQLGRPLNIYQTPVTVTVTQTVTTVYELDYIRFIRTRVGTNTEMVEIRTNFMLLATNVLLSVTNTTPATP